MLHTDVAQKPPAQMDLNHWPYRHNVADDFFLDDIEDHVCYSKEALFIARHEEKGSQCRPKRHAGYRVLEPHFP
jgi:hypothetical protein